MPLVPDDDHVSSNPERVGVMTWLSENVWVAWIALAIVLAAIEALTVDFVFLMFAGGALGGAFTAALDLPFLAQCVVAAIIAVLLLVVVRPTIKRHFTDGETDHGIGVAGLVGREAVVLDTVTPHVGGRVRPGGEVWSAVLADGSPVCEAGSEVQVKSISGATAIVAALPGPDHRAQ